MAFQYQIDSKNNLILETWWDDVTHDELVNSCVTEQNDPLFTKRMNLISDFSHARVKLPPDKLHEFVKFFETTELSKKHAVIVPSTFNGAMLANLWHMFTKSGSSHTEGVKLFKSLDAAKEWIFS